MCSSPLYPGDFTSRKRKQAKLEGLKSGIFWRRRPLWLARGLDKYASGKFFYVDVNNLKEVKDPKFIERLDGMETTDVDGMGLYVVKESG
jgi:hypothetical protein